MSRKTLLAAFVAVLPVPLAAQTPPVIADLQADVAQVEDKLTALAGALPDSVYGWRPAPGVRSMAEVLKHVMADNYVLAAFSGPAPPAATGLDPADYGTARAFEAREMDRATMARELEASFAFLQAALAATTGPELAAPVVVFGRTMTRQRLWILAATHLHEHLGQAIAYARVHGVVPPWSR